MTGNWIVSLNSLIHISSIAIFFHRKAFVCYFPSCVSVCVSARYQIEDDAGNGNYEIDLYKH